MEFSEKKIAVSDIIIIIIIIIIIFRPKGDEVTGEWRELHSEELNELYSSPSIVRVIKSKRRWAVHVARMERAEGYTGFWWGNLRE